MFSLLFKILILDNIKIFKILLKFLKEYFINEYIKLRVTYFFVYNKSRFCDIFV